MGNTNGIEFIEKEYGIVDVKVQDFPDYPIAYIRLCWDFENKKYCIAEDCDIENKHSLHRKILVVGMMLPGYTKIHEQSFYLSSGLNGFDTLKKFFEIDFDLNDESIDLGVWIPFGGFGYPMPKMGQPPINMENDIKLIKSNFNCTTKSSACLFGRFGNQEPNLMQISYCLGGNFWIDNVDKINKQGYSIQIMPTLDDFLRNKKSCIFNYKGISNIDCSIYLNNYIASALVYNYSKPLLSYKEKMCKFLDKKPNNEFLYINVKMDYRIINILAEYGFLPFNRNNKEIRLPYESTFSVDLFGRYITAISNMYASNKEIFTDLVLPIINEDIPLMPRDIYSSKISKKEIKEDLSFVIKDKKPEVIKEDLRVLVKDKKIKSKDKLVETIEIKETINVVEVLGTYENPHSKRKEAKIGEYYSTKSGILKRNK